MTSKRRRHSVEQIIKMLRDADAMLVAFKAEGERLHFEYIPRQPQCGEADRNGRIAVKASRLLPWAVTKPISAQHPIQPVRR